MPVLFLSGKGRDQDVARAFEMGADDYIAKPFSPTELVARVRASLRRRVVPERPASRKPFLLGDLAIDYDQRRVTVGGRPVALTETEYRLLFELAVNAGRVLPKAQLPLRVREGRRRNEPCL